jgi:alpha-L-fucosidase 2
MKTTRRKFLQTSALVSVAVAQGMRGSNAEATAVSTPRGQQLDAFSIAARHVMQWNLPGPSFFEGMLLGNGDVGVCAEVRPDALGLHIAKNDCWDIRVSEDPVDSVLPFDELLQLWKLASEEAIRMGNPDQLYLESQTDVFRQYTETVSSSYNKKWPRPWSCGTIWINWDPRWVRLKDYSLNPANGLFQVNLDINSLNAQPRPARISGFVDWATGAVSVSTSDDIPLESVFYIPAVDTDQALDHAVLPPPKTTVSAGINQVEFSCHQYFPAIGPTEAQPFPPKSDKDRNFSLRGRITGNWTADNGSRATDVVLRPKAPQAFRIDALISTPRDLLLQKREKESSFGRQKRWISIPQDIAHSPDELDTAAYVDSELTHFVARDFKEVQKDSENQWRDYWSRSAIELDDKELERIWYHNQYFLACCLRKHRTAPGLFANWHAADIGTAWHSDYHLDYNCQQVYWGVFSSNHPDMHLPYVELCENLMPIAEKFAKDKYKLPGAFFPVSSYPVPSQSVAYPVPPWAYQVSMTPWTVQSLWWHYLYTQDEDYLRRVYPVLRAAAEFLAAFVQKEPDNRYHIAPTVSSENWGFTVNQRLNKDCIIDLALTKFLLRAMVTASGVLGVDERDAERWKEIYQNLAPYPRADGPYGEVWLDVLNAPVEHVYNVPITLAPVFPGEEIGIGTKSPDFDIAVRTAKTVRLEGGNDLVFQPLVRARLGMLDFEWFKGQVRYCSLPDGIANDRVRQAGGRYPETMNFDFMMRMGVWCENFALPAVLNECMLQSYSGTIRLLPNAEGLGPARFQNLRAAGAFLINAIYDGSKLIQVSLLSEKGKQVHIEELWSGLSIRVTRIRDGNAVNVTRNDLVYSFGTEPGETYRIESA